MAKVAKEKFQAELESYTRLVDSFQDLELKGASMRYTSLNGNMFSFLTDGVLGLRLPAAERELFIKKYETTLYRAHGTELKEYVTVPGQLLKSAKELKKYFEVSYQYAKELKPKPTKRKK